MRSTIPFLAAIHLTAQLFSQPSGNQVSRLPIQVDWDVKIPMRDGKRLSAVVYRNPSESKPSPVILTLTPYIAANASKQGVYFARRGYIFVSVDSRGRGNSEGEFHPGQVEAKDGFDTIEWLAKQPWCDGQVAMWGGSWQGFTQWSIAKEFPPHLKAIAPTASVYPGVDFPAQYGVFMTYMLQWLSFVHGHALNGGLNGESSLWRSAVRLMIEQGRPFADFEEIVGIKGTDFREWLKHPVEDDFWRSMTPNAEAFSRIQIPVLTITGQYDGDQLGALTYYERHMAAASPAAKANHFLVIGPWSHGGTVRPTSELGGLSFGKSAVMDMEELHKAWFDHVLKKGPKPEFLKDRIAAFITGSNTWIYASSLEEVEATRQTYFLDFTGARAGEVLRSGALSQQTLPASCKVSLVSDPRIPPDWEELEKENNEYLKDQQPAYRQDSSSVFLHTEPFIKDVVFSGRARLSLALSLSEPDADLHATLYEVDASGGVARLAETFTRLSLRRGGRPAPMIPGEIEPVELPPFEFFARNISKGSRLRLVLSARPEFEWQRNLQTGDNSPGRPLSSARPCTITLHSGPGLRCQLDVPTPKPSLLIAKSPGSVPK